MKKVVTPLQDINFFNVPVLGQSWLMPALMFSIH